MHLRRANRNRKVARRSRALQRARSAIVRQITGVRMQSVSPVRPQWRIGPNGHLERSTGCGPMDSRARRPTDHVSGGGVSLGVMCGPAATAARSSTRPMAANIGAKFHSLQIPTSRLAPSFPFASTIRNMESSLPTAELAGQQPMVESPGRRSECAEAAHRIAADSDTADGAADVSYCCLPLSGQRRDCDWPAPVRGWLVAAA